MSTATPVPQPGCAEILRLPSFSSTDAKARRGDEPRAAFTAGCEGLRQSPPAYSVTVALCGTPCRATRAGDARLHESAAS